MTVKNRFFHVLMAFALISVIQSFQWEVFPVTGGYASGSFPEKSDASILDSADSSGLESSFQASDVKSATQMDPVILLLLGSGLVGLTGLGRYKV
jgi:hypothetical protein